MNQKGVRDHLFKLMGGKVFSLSRRVNQEELATFCASWNIDNGMSCRPCCSSEYFRFNLLGTPKSAWNRSAARVFAMDYIKTYKLSKKHFDGVAEAFFSRVKYLQAQYKLRLKGPTVVLAAKIERRRNFRKYSVSRYLKLVALFLILPSFFSAVSSLQCSYRFYDAM